MIIHRDCIKCFKGEEFIIQIGRSRPQTFCSAAFAEQNMQSLRDILKIFMTQHLYFTKRFFSKGPTARRACRFTPARSAEVKSLSAVVCG
jgi:hypothetical protein